MYTIDIDELERRGAWWKLVQSISKFCQVRVVGLGENAERICEWLFIKAWFNSSFFFLFLYSPSFFFLPLSDRFRINYWIPGTSSLPSSPSRTIYHSRSRKSSSFPSTSPIQTFKEDASGLDWLPLCVKAASLEGFVTFPSIFRIFPSSLSVSLSLPSN